MSLPKYFYISIRLSILDCLLIMDSFVQKSIIPYFTSISPLEPTWFRFTFPYFWYPFKGIIVTVTMYMVVAISAERFRAVCYPLSKRHVSCFVLKCSLNYFIVFMFYNIYLNHAVHLIFDIH